MLYKLIAILVCLSLYSSNVLAGDFDLNIQYTFFADGELSYFYEIGNDESISTLDIPDGAYALISKQDLEIIRELQQIADIECTSETKIVEVEKIKTTTVDRFATWEYLLMGAGVLAVGFLGGVIYTNLQ